MPHMYLTGLIGIILITCTEQTNIKIANGTNAEEGEFKFMVSLRINLTHECGGTILNKNHVLTAAHCVCDDNGPSINLNELSIQYGSIKISQTEVRSIKIKNVTCANFDMSTLINDVAILELATSLPDDGSWTYTNLSSTFNASAEQKGTIVGWGWLSDGGPYPTILQILDVDIYTDDVCSKVDFEIPYQAQHHVCFGAKHGGACRGDSGSALISSDGYQIGSASFITTTCGTANKITPNVYARISTYFDWINENSKM